MLANKIKLLNFKEMPHLFNKKQIKNNNLIKTNIMMIIIYEIK